MLMNAFFTVWWSCKVRRDRQQNAECQILCDRRTILIKMSNRFSREGLRARELDDTFHNLQRKNIVGRHGNHHLPVLQLINHHPHMFSWFTWITPFVAGMSMLITFAPSIFKRSERKVNLYKIVDRIVMQCNVYEDDDGGNEKTTFTGEKVALATVGHHNGLVGS